MQLNAIDWSIIAAYFLIVFAVAAKWRYRKSNENAQDYFLAGKNLGWFLIGASLFASNVGSEHVVGLVGQGAARGVVVAQFEIIACFALLLLGWFFVPYYIKSGVTTMPEFLELRYSPATRWYLSWISILSYVLTKISVTIYAGGIVFSSMGIPFWLGAVLIILVTGIHTLVGGLKTVMYTDMIQMVIMLLGPILLLFYGLQEIGGWEGLKEALPAEHFHIWQPQTDPQYPWTGILLGAPILAIWYWCTDQFIVQRVLAAKNIQAARQGTMFGGFLKLMPLFIFVVPGMICMALAQQGKLQLGSSDQSYGVLLTHLLPPGLRGLALAGLLAALMSSLSSLFSSCATLMTYDFYLRWRPKASAKQQIFFGRASTTLLIALGLAWVSIMERISPHLFQYIQSVQAYISPPITAVFLGGLLFPKLNARGAMLALWTGFFLGVGRLCLEALQLNIPQLQWFLDINFLHFAFILFVVCSLTLYLGSIPEKESKESSLRLSGVGTLAYADVAISVALIAAVCSIWWLFAPF